MAEKIKLNQPWLVAVWPGMGHVALNAGYYMLSKLDMAVLAELEAGDGNRVIYRFTLRVGDVEVLNGRAAVVLDPSSPPFAQVEKGGSTLPLSPRERGKE